MLWTNGATQGTVVAGNGTIGNSLSQLWEPTGVFVDSLGNVYIADTKQPCGKMVQGATQGTVVATPAAGATPELIYVDKTGNIFMTELQASQIEEWTPGNLQGTVVAGTGSKVRDWINLILLQEFM